MAKEKTVWAPCSSCVRKTTHEVLYEKEFEDGDFSESYQMLECGGCGTISMGVMTGVSMGKADMTYYPSPVSRQKPSWVGSLSIGFVGKRGEYKLGALLSEIYKAVDGGQHRLAAMGIRALLEQVMVAKIGDLQTFEKKMDAFQNAGYMSKVQRDAMKATIDVGHAAMHRAFDPSEDDLKVALDVVEGVMAPLFVHKEAATKLATRVPKRKRSRRR